MKYFYGTTEAGDTVEISLSSLMNAKWDSGGDLIRVNSSLGAVEVEAESLVDAQLSATYDDLVNMYEKDTEGLRAENEQLRKVNNSTYCAYCNASYERTDDALAQVRDHIKVCEYHPMRKLEAENETLKNGIDFYIEAGKVLSSEITSWKENIAEVRTKFLESQRVVGELTIERDRYKAALEDAQKWVFHFREQPEDDDDVLEQYRVNCRRVQKIIDEALKGGAK